MTMKSSPVTHPERRESDLVLPEGLEAGIVGGISVVAVYLIPDMMTGDWVRTPVELGGILLGVVPEEVPTGRGGLVAIYTLVHFTLWAIAGFAGSELMRLAERRPDLRRLPLTVFGIWLVGALMIDLWLVGRGLPMTPLWAGSLIAGCTFGAYLLWRHPDALRER
jgi:hypothetical protein